MFPCSTGAESPPCLFTFSSEKRAPSQQQVSVFLKYSDLSCITRSKCDNLLFYCPIRNIIFLAKKTDCLSISLEKWSRHRFLCLWLRSAAHQRVPLNWNWTTFPASIVIWDTWHFKMISIQFPGSAYLYDRESCSVSAPLYHKQRNWSGLTNWLDCLA